MTDTFRGGGAGTVEFAAIGSLTGLDPEARQRLINRSAGDPREQTQAVAAIIDSVRCDGDAALLRMAHEYDGVALESVEVPGRSLAAALDRLDAPVRDALEQAAGAIAAFHRAQLPGPLDFEPVPGIRLTRVAQPLECVGVYAPGGRAVYPSSVLMGAIPGRVAGAGMVVVCSPPGPDGRPADAVLAACALAGVDRVFAAGGAGAIAAMAHGTATVPRVARIVGPGNAWVTEAKRQLQGVVAIDCPAGPSEIVGIADESADAGFLAAELIAQAEHDPDAAAVLVVTDERLLPEVRAQIEARLAGHPREAVIRAAFGGRGALLVAARDEAIAFASEYAPEHLLLALRDAREALPSIRNAGTIFVGRSSSVVFGDYITGANHVLPTGGLARSFSGLSVLDFLRWTTVQEVSHLAAAKLAGPTAVLADAEGLPGHAAAARLHERAPGRTQAAPEAGDIGGAAPWRRSEYAGITTYDPQRGPTAVDLSDNTNLFGVCPAAGNALSTAPPSAVTRYPAVYADALVEAAADRFGVLPSCVVTGCGSDDIIDSTFRAFSEAGDGIAYPWPTFGIVSSFARMNAAIPIPVEAPPDSPFPASALRAAGARIVYVCRPNNPTGASVPTDDLLAFAKSFSGILVVDEAYADYAEDTLVEEAARSSNLVVLRTLSKAWGLAGLRAGFAIGPAAIVAEIAKSRGPYKVGGLTERAGVAALREGADWVADCVRRTRENRARLERELAARGHAALPSQANFLLLPLPPAVGSAADLARRLRTRGIGVRPFTALPGVGDCIRVTVGPWEMMRCFLDALAAEVPVARKET